jgi:hypothetical protein
LRPASPAALAIRALISLSEDSGMAML